MLLTDPRPLARANLQVLAVGTAEAVDEFAPLPRVPEELHGLQRLYGGAVLLNQDFSPERLEQTVRRGQFGIVHIAAHGRFAPDAAESFMLTAQGKFTIERLADIVGRLRFREQPLELLTLSACETARGDDRAALGLAGVAVQAGARSALATLWLVDDEAATLVMRHFTSTSTTQMCRGHGRCNEPKSPCSSTPSMPIPFSGPRSCSSTTGCRLCLAP
jgi:CHAT domain-containing protein